MTPRPTPHLFGLTLLGTLACTAPADRSAKSTDSGEALPGLEQVFECGELDFPKLWAIKSDSRVYEVACGVVPEGTRWPELSWEELADEYHRLASCDPRPEEHHSWQFVREGCGLEAALNLSIHGWRTAGCPLYYRPPPGELNPTSIVGTSRMWWEAGLAVEDVCDSPSNL